MDPLLKKIFEIFPDFSTALFSQFLNYLNSSSDLLTKSPFLKLNKPYGCNNILKIEDDFGFSFVQLRCGQATSEHFHEQRREFFVVKKGTLSLLKGGLKRTVSVGQWEFSTPLIAHSLQNSSLSEELEILEIFSPPLLDDKIRLQDRYDRKIGKVVYQE